MNKAFDIELFLSGVLRGSSATQRRHIRQARVMQGAIQQRWRQENPWNWRHKHIQWFLVHHLEGHHQTTRYYYQLTALLIWKRMGKNALRIYPNRPSKVAPDLKRRQDLARSP